MLICTNCKHNAVTYCAVDRFNGKNKDQMQPLGKCDSFKRIIIRVKQ